MTDEKWTPGRFAVHPIRAWIVCDQVDDNGDLCPVAALAWPTKYRSECETLANGQLFACAPELYEALLATTEVLEQLHWPEGSDVTSLARAALARARGETPNQEKVA